MRLTVIMVAAMLTAAGVIRIEAKLETHLNGTKAQHEAPASR